VKRIIKLDEEIGACSNSAAFLVTVAAEMFIQYLAKQGYKGAQKDRRKNLQYKDLANAVAALDTLEFLSDTIPRTVPYRKVAAERRKAGGELEAGQMMLNGGDRLGVHNGAVEMIELDADEYNGGRTRSREESMDVEAANENGNGYRMRGVSVGDGDEEEAHDVDYGGGGGGNHNLGADGDVDGGDNADVG